MRRNCGPLLRPEGGHVAASHRFTIHWPPSRAYPLGSILHAAALLSQHCRLRPWSPIMARSERPVGNSASISLSLSVDGPPDERGEHSVDVASLLVRAHDGERSPVKAARRLSHWTPHLAGSTLCSLMNSSGK